MINVKNDIYDDIPIGTIIGMHDSLVNLPTITKRFVLCDGNNISDSESPLNGQATPDLTGGKFLRGNSTSGTTGGTNDAHGHSYSVNTSGHAGATHEVSTPVNNTSAAAIIPPYFEIKFMIKVK